MHAQQCCNCLVYGGLNIMRILFTQSVPFLTLLWPLHHCKGWPFTAYTQFRTVCLQVWSYDMKSGCSRGQAKWAPLLVIIVLWECTRGEAIGSDIIIWYCHRGHKNCQIWRSRYLSELWIQQICQSWPNTGFNGHRIKWYGLQESQIVYCCWPS